MIAIVIPTLNRSKFLKRALEFYSRHDFEGLIYIGDSSGPEEQDRVKDLVSRYDRALNLQYHYFDGPHDGAVITQLNPYIHNSVKYVTFSGDDDFHVPNGLQACAEFLDTHPEYVAAHGHRINFAREGNKVKMMNVRHGYDWGKDSPQLDRLREYLRAGISLSNYLHRKSAWIERYKVCDQIPTRYLGGELCSECTSALLGPVKFLDDVVSFLFYQDNPERVFSFDTTTLFNLMNSSEWARSYSKILVRLTELMEVKNLEVMEQELYFHILNILTAQFQARYGIPPQPPMTQVSPDFGLLAPIIADLLNSIGEIINEEST